MNECVNANCGFDDAHLHGDDCTVDCDCGLGRHTIDGDWLDEEGSK